MSNLPAPELVAPPECACRGLSPQMREHTRSHCSILTTAELDSFWAWYVDSAGVVDVPTGPDQPLS